MLTFCALRRDEATVWVRAKASAVLLLTRGYSPCGPRWPRHAHIASGTGPGGGRLRKWRARVRHIALFLLGQFPNQPPARIAPEGWERAKARRGGARPLPRMASLGCSGEAQAGAGRALLSSSGQRVLLHCTQSLKSPRRCRSRGGQEQNVRNRRHRLPPALAASGIKLRRALAAALPLVPLVPLGQHEHCLPIATPRSTLLTRHSVFRLPQLSTHVPRPHT